MSTDKAREFLQSVFNDSSLMEQIRGRTPDQIVEYASGRGLHFSADELMEAGDSPPSAFELSDSDLDAVAAGARGVGEFKMSAESAHSDVDVCDTEAKGQCGQAPKTQVSSCTATICDNTRGCDSDKFMIKGM